TNDKRLGGIARSNAGLPPLAVAERVAAEDLRLLGLLAMGPCRRQDGEELDLLGKGLAPRVLAANAMTHLVIPGPLRGQAGDDPIEQLVEVGGPPALIFLAALARDEIIGVRYFDMGRAIAQRSGVYGETGLAQSRRQRRHAGLDRGE